MGILRYFTPDRMERDIYCYTAKFFASRGIDRVVFDIDNTVAACDSPVPSERAKQHLLSLKESGVDIMLVSNNSEERVRIFNEGLGFFAVADAHKPSASGLKRCLEQSRNSGGSALVGDQIFTDCLAARRAGISCFLVEPVKTAENAFFRFKRFWERPFIRRYKRLLKRGKL